MELLTANQAKTRFGSTLLKVQQEPVQINKNGKPVAVIMSAEQYAVMDRAVLRSLQVEADRVKSMTEVEINALQDADEFFDELLAGHYD